MKFTHSACVLFLAALATIARADIGIDFVGGSAPGNRGFLGDGGAKTMQPSEVAGVVPQTFWNTAGLANQNNRLTNSVGSLDLLLDSNGEVLPSASLNYKANNTSSTIIPDNPGDNRMMRGYLDSADKNNPYLSSTTTVTLTLPESYARTGYDLIVYFDGGSTVGITGRVGRYRVFDGKTNTGTPVQEIFGKNLHKVDFAGQFVEAHGTTAEDATVGNYIVFHGLKSPIFTLDATGVAGDVQRAPINGIQIIGGNKDLGPQKKTTPVKPVPETTPPMSGGSTTITLDPQSAE